LHVYVDTSGINAFTNTISFTTNKFGSRLQVHLIADASTR